MLPACYAQEASPSKFTDPGSGITFDTWNVPDAPPIGDSEGPNTSGGLTFGVSLPPNSLDKDADEFLGYLVGGNLDILDQSDTNETRTAPRRTGQQDGAVSRWEAP